MGRLDHGVGSDGETALAVAGVVWGEPARSALAPQPGPLCHLGVGNHAAADARGRGGGALQGVHGAVSNVDFAGACAGAGCAGAVERAGLLPARPHAAQGGAVCGQPTSAATCPQLPASFGCCRGLALTRLPPSPASLTGRAWPWWMETWSGCCAGCRGGRRLGARAEPTLRRKIEALAADILDPRRPGDFNQALMELGATVCLPRNPRCLACPLMADCGTRGEHKTRTRPRMLSREVACALSVRTPDSFRDWRFAKCCWNSVLTPIP